MIFSEGISGIRFELKNIAYLRFQKYSEYLNITSPYSRIYLITEGNGYIVIGNRTIELEPGFMYFIPSFVECSYVFKQNLNHIYIHFRARLEKNGLSLSNVSSFHHKIKANNLRVSLFERLVALNPGLELPHHDPQVYQTKPWMNKEPVYPSLSKKLETESILLHLISGFMMENSGPNLNEHLKYNMQDILTYIHENLHNDIKMDQLARIACLSRDHFTRIFRSVMGMAPCEFIIRKRIEKSQFLLLTTNYSMNQIIEKTNFKNAPYFSRMFKKYTTYTPAQYRKVNQLAI